MNYLDNRVELNDSYNYMHARGVNNFPYFVGIQSLSEIATKDDRVCVFNILGSESRSVTPISHDFSGGNIVFGTMPGRSGGILKTSTGGIKVYNNILEALDSGHRFNTAVVYVPPSGVKDSVIEAVRINPELKKIFIITEKVPVRDTRIIRQFCQWAGIDVFGANCLGVADAHNKVRIGGALGGSSPEESLIPGSVAIFSNSGNFTTTIAVYLSTAGWGSTVSISSGKDLYIHFAAPEFVNAFHNDTRSKAAVMYIEPGGYYEKNLVFKKPVVACIVGRWKEKLTRPCGHAGAVTGTGDSAVAKEKWLMEKFEVEGIYTPETPHFSAKGAVVTNISHIPQALTEVMKLNDTEPDFEPKGNLSLKCWFQNTQGIELPTELQNKVVEAVSPYNEQIETLNKQVGITFPRQSLKDASGASRMDPKDQISRIHNVSILKAATKSFEENLFLSLIREYPDESSSELLNIILNSHVNLHNTSQLIASQAARDAGNSPNTSLSAALAIIGPNSVKKDRKATQAFIDLFGLSYLNDPADINYDFQSQLERASEDSLQNILLTSTPCDQADNMLKALGVREVDSIFIRFLKALAEVSKAQVPVWSVHAAITCHLAWSSLRRKRLTINTIINMPWHFKLFGTMIGATVDADQHTKNQFCNIDNTELINKWSFTETTGLSFLGRKPNSNELFSFSLLLGLLTTNGPGTISAQGAKGAVSADGPEIQKRVQINKAYLGFLSHSGYVHGGNGFEAISFLIEQFDDKNLKDPSDPNHSIDLNQMATDYANWYKQYKTKSKTDGVSYWKIPCINHPVFKGKEINFDPREVFVNNLLKENNDYNIFHEFYHKLVHALHKIGVSNNVYCVNIDAVIAVTLLKTLWKPFKDGQFTHSKLETTAFTTFLLGRMIGTAAEIEDHTNRGRNMDTRTPASKCSYTG